MLKKQLTISSIAVCIIIGGNPAKAQWDLNGTVPNPMDSAGVGDIGVSGALGSPHSNNGGLSINQTYNTGSNAMMPNNAQTQYNHLSNGQSGYLNNVWGQHQNAAAQSTGQQLHPTYTPRLSLIQNQGLINNLPGGLKGVVNGLPPTSLDSFVKNAGGQAEAIYGDEGTNSWPRISGFGRGNTINAGIVGQRSKTLTTGHGGDRLPTASGNGTEKAR